MSKARKNQIARLDKLWSRLVLDRDNHVCQKCFKFGDNPHHVILKRYLAVRHLLDNGLTLCTKCHIEEAHGQPGSFEWWFHVTFINRDDLIQYLKHEIKTDLNGAEKRLKILS